MEELPFIGCSLEVRRLGKHLVFISGHMSHYVLPQGWERGILVLSDRVGDSHEHACTLTHIHTHTPFRSGPGFLSNLRKLQSWVRRGMRTTGDAAYLTVSFCVSQSWLPSLESAPFYRRTFLQLFLLSQIILPL